jgi:hypothetical protein
MDTITFKAFLSLLMCSDPTPIDAAEDLLLRDWADAQAKLHGYSDWIEAYHKL